MYRLYLWLLLSLLVTHPLVAQKSIKIAGGRAPAGIERRLALVVGNKNYNRTDARLTNPINDANDMANALELLGFEVILKTDLNRVDFEQAVDQFGERLKHYDVGLFYYSGHGLQAQGENYLVPVDAVIRSEPQIRYHCMDLGRVLAAMEGSNASTNIVLLDACRNNPYKKSWSKGGLAEGLTIPRNPPGTIVVFATSENSVADDNTGERNGLFTAKLLKNIRQPNRSLSQILAETRRGVYTRSNKQQVPADYNKLMGDFVFVIQDKGKNDTRTADQPFGPAMVYVRGGSFPMGSEEGETDEKPVHQVTVSAFLMGKYEVTVAEFEQFIEATRYQTDAEKEGHSYTWNGKDWKKMVGVNWRCDAEGNVRPRSDQNHPVLHVSWNDAVAYCEWLSRRTGKRYRLPTEAEWEYAAGNGSAHTKFSWGDMEPSGLIQSNIADRSAKGLLSWANENINDGYRYTAPVGSYAPNRFGLYDMTGNVHEWCQDLYSDTYYSNYSSASGNNPTGPVSGSCRVLRGGCWNSIPQHCRSTDRGCENPAIRHDRVGFRVVSPIQ
ncbi:hypothetical protein GCM10023187_52890 [Nibrella viscosa]|uniref:Caspase family p20 domain-containing protein n=1 Tax=Nibrella viscosa TaxID=1084524 RepID=A0ABP8KYC0_9BACT